MTGDFLQVEQSSSVGFVVETTNLRDWFDRNVLYMIHCTLRIPLMSKTFFVWKYKKALSVAKAAILNISEYRCIKLCLHDITKAYFQHSLLYICPLDNTHGKSDDDFGGSWDRSKSEVTGRALFMTFADNANNLGLG